MSQLPQRRREQRAVGDRTVIFSCHSGGRSESVCLYLEANEGFEDLVNMEGGIVAWHQAGLPVASAQ